MQAKNDRNVPSLNRLQLFARLEADGFARRDIDFLTGARVATDARLARLDVEDAETAEFDPASASQGGLQRFKNGFNSLFGLRACYACAGDDCVHDVELDQARLLLKTEAYANTRT
jgi:hypothetical protein